jgi:hypothetical protein
MVPSTIPNSRRRYGLVAMISMIEGSLCMLGKEGCCDAQVVETWNADLMEAVISDLPLSYKNVPWRRVELGC